MTLRVRRMFAQAVAVLFLATAPVSVLAAHAETVTPTPSPAATAASQSPAPTDSVTPFIDTIPDANPDNSRTFYALLGAGLLALGAAAFTFFKR